MNTVCAEGRQPPDAFSAERDSRDKRRPAPPGSIKLLHGTLTLKGFHETETLGAAAGAVFAAEPLRNEDARR